MLSPILRFDQILLIGDCLPWKEANYSGSNTMWNLWGQPEI